MAGKECDKPPAVTLGSGTNEAKQCVAQASARRRRDHWEQSEKGSIKMRKKKRGKRCGEMDVGKEEERDSVCMNQWHASIFS